MSYDYVFTCWNCSRVFDSNADSARCPKCGRLNDINLDGDPHETEPDFGGSFDGHTVTSDADPGL